MTAARTLLIVAGALSIAASLLHVAAIIGGPDWYRWLGAGEPMARAAERGSMIPHLLTAVIAAIIGGWALYAFSAAGLVRRLPLIRTALVAIATVLLARAALAFVPGAWAPEQSVAFIVWTSLACFVLGGAFALGTAGMWRQLSRKGTS